MSKDEEYNGDDSESDGNGLIGALCNTGNVAGGDEAVDDANIGGGKAIFECGEEGGEFLRLLMEREEEENQCRSRPGEPLLLHHLLPK